MKKMSFTLFKPGALLSVFGKSAIMVLAAWCCIGLQSATAQIAMPSDGSCTTHTIEACGGDKVQFTDDNSVDDRLYADTDDDGGARTDTVVFCPQDQWHIVTVTFDQFDIHGSDLLSVYQGDKDAVKAGLAPEASANGSGASSAFGGWASAACSPDDNPSGCLSFIFTTDGGETKGTGWDAWVSCADRGIELTATLNNGKIECHNARAWMGFGAPTITTECEKTDLGDPIVCFQLRNNPGAGCTADGEPLCQPLSAWQAVDPSNPATAGIASFDLAVGIYTGEYFLQSDPTKTTGRLVFSVDGPSLVCNDELNIPLNSGCGFELAPDDLLENPCDTIAPWLQYKISVQLNGSTKSGSSPITGETGITLTGSGTSAMGTPIVWVTKQHLEDAGVSECGGTATVTIERIYYGGGFDVNGSIKPGAPNGCDNGIQRDQCTTIINFSDQTDPIVQLTTVKGPGANDVPTLISCDTTGLYKILSAQAIDNCDSDIDMAISVVYDETDPCLTSKNEDDDESNTTTVTVTYTATDNCGNTGTASQDITLIRPNTNMVVLVEKDVQKECTDATADFAGIGVQRGYVGTDGATVICDTLGLNETDYICGYIASKVVEEIPGNDCGRKEFVNWSVLDWCDPSDGPSFVGTQFINYTDTEAPVFADGDNYQDFDNRNQLPTVIEAITLGAWDCTFDASGLTAPVASDNCGQNVTVRLAATHLVTEDLHYGVLSGKRDSISAAWAADVNALTADTFRLMYIAEDACHEQPANDTIYCFIAINDNTKPSAVCTDQLNVSIGTQAVKVFAKDIDGGSFDACGIETPSIRVEGSGDDFTTDYLVFGCDDVHANVKVELLVTDGTGNTNTCWTYVTVEDKVAPICAELPAVSVNCDEEHVSDLGADTDSDGDGQMEDSEWADLSGDVLAFWNGRYGDPATACSDNAGTCQSLTIEQQYQVINKSCGVVTAKRRYRAIDWQGEGNKSAWSEQIITINYVPGWKVTLPADVEVVCEIDGDNSTPLYGADDVVISSGSCDQIAVEVEAREFIANEGACKKIEVTYHVINWCVYNAGDDAVSIDRVENGHGNVTEGQMVSSADNGNLGYFTYTRTIKLVDNVAPVVYITDEPDYCITGADCTDTGYWEAWAADCADDNNFTWTNILYVTDTEGNTTQVEGTGNSITAQLNNKFSYSVEFWAADGCGNSGGHRTDAKTAWDCKQPTPYALNGIAISIMPTGMVAVWASDLDQGSFDNCDGELDLRIRKAGEGAPTTLAEVEALGTSVAFECLELGTQSVELYAIDDEGNYDFVSTYVIIQDNIGACLDIIEGEDMGQVAGTVLNADGEFVQAVDVSVNGGMTSMSTPDNGHYLFSLNKGADYTITPEKNVNPLNGVSTFDLVLISKHILGIQSFDSPYKYIAADINKSGSITAFDMVQLRQLILNITTEFPNNTSWRFVDAAHQFGTSPLNDNFNEFISINDLAADMTNIDFVGVKVGDVNGNARPNSLTAAEVRNTAGTMNLTTANQYVEAGQTVSVPFTSADMTNVAGYQFTMNYAGLELAQLVEGAATADNFNTNMRGALTASWNGQATANDVLFTLNFTATTAGNLSDLLSVNSNVTVAEAYTTNGEALDVAINFTAGVAAEFGLAQNTPNPFNANTTIGFTLPTAGAATLKVMDVQGKVLMSITQDFAKGFNSVELNAKDMGATGVLHYQLESADNVATKKMIIIE